MTHTAPVPAPASPAPPCCSRSSAPRPPRPPDRTPAPPRPRPPRTIAVGSNPYAIAVSDARGEAYVVNDGSVSVISLLSHRPGGRAEDGLPGSDEHRPGPGRHAGLHRHVRRGHRRQLRHRAACRARSRDRRAGRHGIVSARTPAGEYAYVALETARRLAGDPHVRRPRRRRDRAARRSADRRRHAGGHAGVGGTTSEAGTVWVVDTATQRRVRTLQVEGRRARLLDRRSRPTGRARWSTAWPASP